MLHQPHVVDVDVRVARLGQDDGIIPEPEALGATLALGDREEALAVNALDASHQVNRPVQLDRAGVERAVDSQPLHQVRVRPVVQVVAPEDRRVLGREHRVLEPVEEAVAPVHDRVVAMDQGLVLGQELIELALEHLGDHDGSSVG